MQQIFEGDVKQIPKKGHLPTPVHSVIIHPIRSRISSVAQDHPPAVFVVWSHPDGGFGPDAARSCGEPAENENTCGYL